MEPDRADLWGRESIPHLTSSEMMNIITPGSSSLTMGIGCEAANPTKSLTRHDGV